MRLEHGDCLAVLKTLPDSSVDCCLTDPPYNLTNSEVDQNVLDWPAVWAELNRVCKPAANIALFCAFPFTADLIRTNRRFFRYAWTWQKNTVSNSLMARYMPLRQVEHIAVFFNGRIRDNGGKFLELRTYMQEERRKSGLSLKTINEMLGNYMASHYFTDGVQFRMPTAKAYELLQRTGYWQRPYSELLALYQAESSTESPQYHPPGVTMLDKPKKSGNKSKIYKAPSSDCYYQTMTGWPAEVLRYKAVPSCYRLSSFEKPVELLKFLLETYTRPGEVVLDFCMGSGSCGQACLETGRDFVGIEIDDTQFRQAQHRLTTAAQQAA